MPANFPDEGVRTSPAPVSLQRRRSLWPAALRALPRVMMANGLTETVLPRVMMANAPTEMPPRRTMAASKMHSSRPLLGAALRAVLGHVFDGKSMLSFV